MEERGCVDDPVTVAGKGPAHIGTVATFADPKHDVDSVRDEVDASVGDKHIEANCWVASAKLREDGPHRLEVR